MADNDSSVRLSLRSTYKRFNTWCVLFVLSLITLGSVLDQGEESVGAGRWRTVVALSSISAIVACIMVSLHFISGLSKKISGKTPEGIVVSLVLILWCIGLPIIMNPSNDFAVTSFAITNANLYFSAWGAFLAVVFIFGSFLQEYKIMDVSELSAKAHPMLIKWVLLMTASVIVLASAIKIYKDDIVGCGRDKSTTTCQRTIYAISLGVIGSVLALSAAGLYKFYEVKPPLAIESAFAFVAVVLYCVGVAYVTSPNGPGRSVGNLYLSIWFGFIISFFLGSTSIKELLTKRHSKLDTEDASQKPQTIASIKPKEEAKDEEESDNDSDISEEV
eukprot:scaffold47360_cov46-Attheya_sp.AAC.1